MKTKSIFISTIAMVVLLVVALATGTFAWYSAQQSASATAATVSAAASTNASIGLSWTGADYGPGVLFGTGANIGPMIPSAALVDYTTAGGETGDVLTGTKPAFIYSTTANNGTYDYFKTNGQTATPWRQIDSTGSSSSLTIKNIDSAQASTVTATVTIPQVIGSNSDILRVAIFVEAPTSTFDLIGVWGPTSPSSIWFGSIVADANVNTIMLNNDGANFITPTTDASTSFILQPLGTAAIRVYAWLDGTVLDSPRSLDANYTDPTFSITFNATEYNP